MARPRKTKSVDAQSSTGTGDDIETGGRITVSIFVVARNLDTSNDSLEVSLEGSPDGTHWADVETLDASGRATITVSDLEDHDGDGTFTGLLSVQGVATEFVRANAVTFTDDSGSDLEVDAWVSVTNNPDGAQSFREV